MKIIELKKMVKIIRLCNRNKNKDILIILVKNYPLHDINGKEITGATLRLSYELGTHYQVKI
jgi:hypothetical protein